MEIKIIIQFEDFANHNTFKLLAKYSFSYLVFNDDIQGTSSVVLVGLLASLKLLGGTLANHRFLFLGVGECTPTIVIWSIDCIFDEVLTRKPPFPGKTVVHRLELITGLLGTPSAEIIIVMLFQLIPHCN